MTTPFAHTSVLLPESINLLQPRSGGRYIDATLGAGGHAERILDVSGPDSHLLGIDADPLALEAAQQRLAHFGDRIVLANAFFDELDAVAHRTGFGAADGVLFDLGVSSPQLDTAERGFSFQREAPLDMRLGPAAPATAAELIATLPERELERIFRDYGEERFARRVARRIVQERGQRPIRTTTELAALVSAAKPHTTESINPATRIFQALRIAVNDELRRLQRALPQAVAVLRGGSRLVVISFHSLEDRIVKQFLRQEAKGCICPPNLPVCVCGRQPTLRILTPHPLVASADEIAANPRARSAKLRAAERLTSNPNSGPKIIESTTPAARGNAA